MNPQSPAPPWGGAITAGQLAQIIAASEWQVYELARKGIAVRAPDGRGFLAMPSLRAYIVHLRDVAAERGISDSTAAARLALDEQRAEYFRLKNSELRNESVTQGELISGWAVMASAFRGAAARIERETRKRLPHLTRHDHETIAAVAREALSIARDEIRGLTVTIPPNRSKRGRSPPDKHTADNRARPAGRA